MHLSAILPLAAALLLLAMTGCVVPGDNDGAVEADPTTVQKSSADGGDGYLRGLREYHWATDETLGQAALRFPLHFAQAANCQFQFAGNVHVEDSGPIFLLVKEQKDEAVFAAYSWDAFATVYASPFEVRGLLLDTRAWTYRGLIRDRFEGDFTLTHLTREAFPDGKNGYAPGFGLAVSLVCDGPFDIVGAKMGDEATLVDQHNLTGNGAVVGAVGNAVNATASALVVGEVAGFYMASFGDQAGQAELHHPGGVEKWMFLPNNNTILDSPVFYSVPAGPGAYDFSMTRASIGGARSFWLTAVYGLSRPLDLASGRHEQSVITQGN